jgi:hypothetical protein
MIEPTSPASLIPVLVKGIQQRHVRAALDQNNKCIRFEMDGVVTGLPTQAGWIPVTSTGMRECTSA